MANCCQCGHPQLKHLYGGYGACNEFKCICDRYVFKEVRHIYHCCNNDLHFDCSGSAIDCTKDNQFKHRGKCGCICHKEVNG